MTDLEFQSQLSRLAELLPQLKTPAQMAKTHRHPDLGRAVARVETAFGAAQGAIGTNDPEIYNRVLVALRQATGSWRTVDDRYGQMPARARSV